MYICHVLCDVSTWFGWHFGVRFFVSSCIAWGIKALGDLLYQTWKFEN
jgi:hypothetical protein